MQGLSVISDLVLVEHVSVLSTPGVVPRSPLSTMLRGRLCSALCILQMKIVNLGEVKAQGDLIVHCPNQDTIECERGCFYWLLQDNGGKRGLSPASQDV